LARVRAASALRLLTLLWIGAASFAPPCAATTPAVGAGEASVAGRKEASDSLLGNFSFAARNEPIAVMADSLDFDYRTRVLTYSGNVVVTQADLKLQSDTLRVELADRADAPEGAAGDAQLKAVIASGHVRLEKGSRWAVAGRGVFDQIKRTVTLTENAVLHDGDNQVSGDRLIVYLDEQRTVVDGGGEGGRVKAVLYPNREGDAKEEAKP